MAENVEDVIKQWQIANTRDEGQLQDITMGQKDSGDVQQIELENGDKCEIRYYGNHSGTTDNADTRTNGTGERTRTDGTIQNDGGTDEEDDEEWAYALATGARRWLRENRQLTTWKKRNRLYQYKRNRKARGLHRRA